MGETIRVVVVGAGHMGASHARAYHQLNGFKLVGIVAPTPARRSKLAKELGGIAEYDNHHPARRIV